MGSRKTLTQRFLTMAKAHRRITTSNGSKPATTPNPGDPPKEAGGIFGRFLRSPASMQAIPMVAENLPSIDITRERIRLEGLIPSPLPEYSSKITPDEARKLVKVARMEMVKSNLMKMGDCITVNEFLRVCGEASWDSDHAREIAKSLDESGSVIVLGNAVFLRPDQFVRAMKGIVPLTEKQRGDKRELEQLERKKMAIDKKAEASVRRELWAGLGFLMVQTVGFMRLTFWELSWDVMEPICFYVTSMYCMGGYAFFLKTSTEPSFEGFYKSRFQTKQRKLMSYYKFDEERYNKLKRGLNARPLF